ncbi:DUF4157 domain-containing protein [Tropicimonas sp. IMCC34043]|uniref:eCIS core domain-containing protein n=1 Tax=Tropicimonas sp. IMCC34043 TaxID=2248760 RepID=UPI000E224ADD|nr:DUF4157 domain-containing protein [Tropicimonas sp. IMCC34043]
MSCCAAMGRPSRRPARAPRIAPPEAEAEREAREIASRVSEGTGIGALSSAATGGGVIHRQCAACVSGGPPCAACSEDAARLRRSPQGDAARTTGAGAARSAAAALSGGGRPLPAALAGYFAPRFGADLSAVRLHTDSATAEAAQDIGARAYALGPDIGFAAGAFAPATGEGRELIAHELVHTLQGDGALHRDPDEEEPRAPTPPTTASETFQDSSGGGETEFTETVETAPTVAGDHIQGSVRRIETAPAGDGRAREEVSNMTSFIDFNAATCEIRLPYRFGFRRAADDPRGQSCEGETVSDVDVDAIATRYIDAVNAELNDQFTIRLSDCDSACAGREIPIRISASRDDADPDRVIDVVTRSGRGDARTLCAGSFDPSFAVHESGHQILGRGDEYPERDPDVVAAVPRWGRPERVRSDYNYMGSHYSFGRFAVFHERDFRHVQVFMQAALPDCQAELRGVPQLNIAIRPFANVGFGTVGGASGFTGGGGIDLGIPLTRGREWQLLLGASADYLAQLEQDRRQFVLAGMRAGLEYQLQGRDISGRFFGGGRLGVSQELETRPLRSDEVHGPRTSAFGEAELGAGVLLPVGGGGALTADVRLRAGSELGSDPQAVNWFNVGFSLGARF